MRSIRSSIITNFVTIFTLSVLLPLRPAAVSDPTEVASLLAIKHSIGDAYGKLSNWVGDDPCGTVLWTGVYCLSENGVHYVQELRLMNMNFSGTLAPHVGNLTHLTILNFMWNQLTGPVPPEIGKLSELHLLLLDGNAFSGSLPLELGNLSKLNRLQLNNNNLTGPVPPSLQHMVSLRHIHLNNNSLSGNIPRELGQLPALLHLLLDNNNMGGELPSELSNISTLVILQLDNNNFIGSIPSSYSTMSNLSKLSLRINDLSGTIPDLQALPYLAYLDLSENNLNGSLPSLNSKTQALTTIILSLNKLDGEMPLDYLAMPTLEFLLLQNNLLNGSISADQMTVPASKLIVDLQNNSFSDFIAGGPSSSSDVIFRLYGNPLCSLSISEAPPNSCAEYLGSYINDSAITTPPQIAQGCNENTCDVANNQELVTGLLALGQCRCAYPVTVGMRLKSPSFAYFEPYTDGFDVWISSGLQLQKYQVDVSEYNWEPGPRLAMTVKLFPGLNTSTFEQSQVDYLYSVLSNWSMPPNNTYGPYELRFFTAGFPYDGSRGASTNGQKLSNGAIVAIVVAAVVVTAAIVVVTMFLLGNRWHYNLVAAKAEAVRHQERIKVAGVKSFSFEEMAKATKNFDSFMQIGQGGYGKVYKAVLADGVLAAIKRAEVGSLQGTKEFRTEIELLSRVHHRNLVSLIGYCDDAGEQMLVYEFMENGTLRGLLVSQAKIPLDFPARLQIALGAAKGILYLHTEANPPIFHRDIKATNILLDEKRRAKVADFGLSKLAPVADFEGEAGGYVSTVVKGTPGYLDPEYFLTHQLTDKSDVYSFGVVLLELVTGLEAIYEGKNLIREVTQSYEAGTVLSMVDSRMGTYPSECMMPLIQLAIACCKDDPNTRPSMSEVVRILALIWQSTLLPDSSTFSEMSMDMESTNLRQKHGFSNLFVSSDTGSNSGIFSSSIPELAPR